MSISFPTPNGPIRLTGPVAAFLRRSQTGGTPPPAADLAAGTAAAREYLARLVRPEYVSLPFRGPHDLDNWTGETWEIRRAYRSLLLKEAAVKAALKSKVAAVASLAPQVLPEDKASPRDRAAARFVDWAVARSHGGWPGVVRAIAAGALIDGFSVCEKVLAPTTAGQWPGFWGLEELAPLDTRYIRLDVDPYKRVTAVRYVRGQASQAFDPRDFTAYAYQALWGSPFGISDLRAAYRPAALIEAAVRLRAVLLENFAGPFLVGSYQPGDQGQKEELLAVLREARATGYVVVPDGDEVTVLNLATSADAQFGAAIEDYRKEIYTAIRGAYLPFSEGAAGARVGSSRVHQDTADLDAWDLAVDVAEVVNRQLIPDLVRPNFGDGVGLPRVTLGARDPDAALKTLEIVKAVQAAGVPVSAAFVYEASGVEPPSGPDDVAGGSPQGPPPADRAFADSQFDPAKHPRDDHGRFIDRLDIQLAARDPSAERALRERVTKPEEQKKLDTAITAARQLVRPGPSLAACHNPTQKEPQTDSLRLDKLTGTAPKGEWEAFLANARQSPSPVQKNPDLANAEWLAERQKTIFGGRLSRPIPDDLKKNPDLAANINGELVDRKHFAAKLRAAADLHERWLTGRVSDREAGFVDPYATRPDPLKAMLRLGEPAAEPDPRLARAQARYRATAQQDAAEFVENARELAALLEDDSSFREKVSGKWLTVDALGRAAAVPYRQEGFKLLSAQSTALMKAEQASAAAREENVILQGAYGAPVIAAGSFAMGPLPALGAMGLGGAAGGGLEAGTQGLEGLTGYRKDYDPGAIREHALQGAAAGPVVGPVGRAFPRVVVGLGAAAGVGTGAYEGLVNDNPVRGLTYAGAGAIPLVGYGRISRSQGTPSTTRPTSQEWWGAEYIDEGVKFPTPRTGTVDANSVRFSQNSVSYNKVDRVTGNAYTYDQLVESMRKEGWKGDPVDVVRMPDSRLTSLDNTRIRAAREAGIEAQTRQHNADDRLSGEEIDRFTVPGKPRPLTWGQAIALRIDKQSGGFGRKNPLGSDDLPRLQGKKP